MQRDKLSEEPRTATRLPRSTDKDAAAGGSITRARRGAAAPAIRLLLVDDHAAVREAMRLLLDSLDGIEVVGTAADGREAVAQAEQLLPDIVIMDMVMPGMNGLEAARRICKKLQHSRVIMFTAYLEERRLLEALRVGVSGYLWKRADRDELQRAIRAVHVGELYLSQDIADALDIDALLARARTRDERSAFDLLSAREREVLQLIAEGEPRREIAEQLCISVRTVDAHQSHIMEKLHTRSRSDLIRFALEHQMVGTEPVEAMEGHQLVS